MVAVLLVVGIRYVNDCYRADASALAVMADENGTADGIEVRELNDGDVAFVPTEVKSGLVFYPGGKVQPEAYAPLMQKLAEEGFLCVLVRPPLPTPSNGIFTPGVFVPFSHPPARARPEGRRRR